MHFPVPSLLRNGCWLLHVQAYPALITDHPYVNAEGLHDQRSSRSNNNSLHHYAQARRSVCWSTVIERPASFSECGRQPRNSLYTFKIVAKS